MAWRSCSVLFRVGEGLFRCSTKNGRWPHNVQQKCGFRKASRKPETKKVEEELGSSRTEPVEAEVHHRTSPSDTPRASQLIKPLVFTVGFTGCSFGLAAIWQYESVKFRVQSFFDQVHADWLEKLRPQKRGDFRKEVNRWWNSLSEGQKTVTGIIAANVLVFCCWRIPSLQPTMLKYFISTPASKALCLPMLLSTFSHYSFFHMAANMYVLWSFSSSAVSMLGREQFMALYLSAGVVSTFVSYVSKVATGRICMSVGASGAIMTILATVCTKMPEAKLAIIFLPMFTFTAANALKAIVALDTAGLLLGWQFFDHAAHLGGTMFGIWYALYGHDLIWKNREPFVKVWHNFRTQGGGGRGGGAGSGGSA
ncbi:presenilins-associated rhomboid-like protein, mitochondrial isoform X2 [Cynoglossus semilaevis]|uniref:presenilins-associated rhomboid-like protein, mitochondrial isoform X2 n=1 Tax=Cynoglossus semilaevis TaxID=244447 RepID=UPI0007DCB652|nr:presenilins-associated rhomboid-like protein, mitochondrial isoform X2 [Cynoglossus semilaevis]